VILLLAGSFMLNAAMIKFVSSSWVPLALRSIVGERIYFLSDVESCSRAVTSVFNKGFERVNVKNIDPIHHERKRKSNWYREGVRCATDFLSSTCSDVAVLLSRHVVDICIMNGGRAPVFEIGQSLHWMEGQLTHEPSIGELQLLGHSSTV